MSKFQKNPNVLISKPMLNVNISKGQMPNVKISKIPKIKFQYRYQNFKTCQFQCHNFTVNVKCHHFKMANAKFHNFKK